MSLNLIPRTAGHEHVCVGIQAFGAPLGAATLEVGDLLDARVEFGLPRVFGYIDIFAVEYIVDGCCAVSMSVLVRAKVARRDDVTGAVAMWGKSKKKVMCRLKLTSMQFRH